MDPHHTEIWNEAHRTYLDTLSDRQRQMVQSIQNQEHLLHRIEDLKRRYDQNRVSQLVERLHPLLAHLGSFSEVIKAFVQINGPMVSPIWGSVYLIIELASRHASVLEMIGDAFESFDRCLPRFSIYLQRYGGQPLTQSLKTALIQYYTEFIGFCSDSIQFLNISPTRNLLRLSRPAHKYKSSFERRTNRLKILTDWVDLEAAVAVQDWQTQNIKLWSDVRPIQTRPTKLLPYHNLPKLRNNHFYGREDVLQQLSSHLDPNTTKNTSRPRSCGIFGLGGCGKSQIALEYAYRNLHNYAVVIWVMSDTHLKLAESFAQAAIDLGLADENIQQRDQACGALKRWLLSEQSEGENNPPSVKWLLIFDNVDDGNLLGSYWPSGANGSVILTTRNREITYACTDLRLQIQPFSNDEGRSFLLKRAYQGSHHSHEDTVAASYITRILGHLPLALNMTASYIASTGMTFVRFLEVHHDLEDRFVLEDQTSGFLDTQQYQHSIRTAWTFKFSVMSSETVQLMGLIAILDPDGIPETLFQATSIETRTYNWVAALPEELLCINSVFDDKSLFELSVAHLLRDSLVERKRDKMIITCHRLVQLAVRNHMNDSSLNVTFKTAVYLLNGRFPKQDSGILLHDKWKECEVLYSQTSALLNIWETYQSTIETPVLLCEVVRRCSWFLLERAQFMEALEMIKIAIKICDKCLSETNNSSLTLQATWLTADLTHTKSSISYELNEKGHGLALAKKAKTIRESIAHAGYQFFDTWLILADGPILLSLMAEGRASEALPLMENLLKFARRPLEDGSPAPNLELFLQNGCLCNLLLGRLDTAVKAWDESKELIRQRHGDESQMMATALFNLGNVRLAQGLPNEAFDIFSNCLRIRQLVIPNHHYTGLTFHKLGILVRERGDIPTAIKFFREAIRILEASESHPGACARSMHVLAALLRESRSFDEAEKIKEREHKFLTKINDGSRAHLMTETSYEKFVLFCHR